MEKKDNYTFSDLVFGLRGEYQKQVKTLNLLKHFCKSEKGIGNDFYFFVHQEEGQEPELRCRYSKQENLVQKGISKIKNLVIGIPEGVCRKDYRDNYYIDGSSVKFPVEVQAPISFTSMASEVLESEFFQKMKLQKASNPCYIRSANKEGVLLLSFDGVQYFKYQGDYPNGTIDYSAVYDAYKDRILFTAFDKKLSMERLKETIYTEFSKGQLDSYHVNLIDSSGILEKRIVLDEIRSCSMTEYTIFEDKEKLVLTKWMSR